MYTSACRACDSTHLSILGEFRGFPSAAQSFYDTRSDALSDPSVNLELRQCQSCSLIQIPSAPVPYFRQVITAAAIGAATAKKIRIEWIPLIDGFLEPTTRILEVGSGRGDFVDLLRSWGFQAEGLESEPPPESGSHIHRGYFPETRLSKKYDLIVCNNFLEHHPSPRLFLQSVNGHLEQSGLFYVSVPRYEYLYDKSCFYELIPDHLSYFTEESLINLLRNAGFDILKYYTKNLENDHVVFCRKRNPLNISSKVSEFESIVGNLADFMECQSKAGKSVSVWGAGHRTLTLLSMVKNTYVVSIVDSAPFKQGKFSPITGIPIVSPEEFFKSPSEILLLMLPGAYADQVRERILCEGFVGSVYLFDDTPEIKKIA